MKNILIGVTGTRGDIFPALALAQQLQGRHNVTVLCTPDFRELFKDHGIACSTFGQPFDQVIGSRDIRAYQRQVANQYQMDQSFIQHFDVMIGSGLFYALHTFAQKYDKAFYHILYTPQALQSTAYPPPGSPPPFDRRLRNRLLWFKSRMENNLLLRSIINHQRENLHLGSIKDVYQHFIGHDHLIIASDPLLAPVDEAYTDHVMQIHCLQPEIQSALDPTLQSFIDQHPSPVVVTFGSNEQTLHHDIQRLQRTVKCIRKAGHSLILIGRVPENIYESDPHIHHTAFAPLNTLLPDSALIIHHGGIGTFHTAAQAGIPQIIVPHGMDQYYWAQHVQRLHLGTVIYDLDQSYAAALTNALEATLQSPSIHQAAADVRKRLNAADYQQEGIHRLQQALPACFTI